MKAIRVMPSDERTAMNKEIRRQCIESVKQYDLDYDALNAYILSKEFGFGEQRIRKFLKVMIAERKHLEDYYYSKPDEEYHYIAMREYLERKGINIEEIEKELIDDELGKS